MVTNEIEKVALKIHHGGKTKETAIFQISLYHSGIWNIAINNKLSCDIKLKKVFYTLYMGSFYSLY